jgi:hypothetical protein
MMVMKSFMFFDVIPYSPLKVNGRIPPKLRLNFNGLHGFAYQKIGILLLILFGN